MNEKTQQPVVTLEREVAFDPQSLAVISKAEIDMQIATAHRFPRVVSTFLADAEQLVTLNEFVADECIYSLPARGDSEEAIEGPSSRFAEVIAHAWGNCRAGARVIGEDGGFIVAQGAFHDLQKNVAISYEVRRRITNRSGRRYSDDMIGVTGNAACSIALRNAILKGVPKAFWIAPYEAARKVLVGDYKTLEKRRTETLERFKKFGVQPDRIFEKYGIKALEDLTLELVFQLRTMLNAIRDGDTTIEEQFPKAPSKTERSASAGLADALGVGGAKGATDPGDEALRRKEQETAQAAAQDDAATKTEKGKKGDAKGPDAQQGRRPGTPEVRDDIMAKLRKAKTIDELAEEADKANLWTWTQADLGAINGVYHEQIAKLSV